MPHLGALPTLALILSVLGGALSVVTLFIHDRLAASQGDYTSFCDVSAELSCDVVLGSPWATFLGVPVAGWALASYLACTVLAIALMRAGVDLLPRVATAFVALTGAMLGISAYFFIVSTFLIGVACPMCLSLDAVNVALFGTALAVLRSAVRPGFSPQRPLWAAAGLTLLAIAVLSFAQAPRDVVTEGLTLERIRKEDPRFYAWYISQPVVEPPLGRYPPAEAGVDITVVEFSDFECPHCRRAFLDLNQVKAADPRVRILHRNFPLHADCNPAVSARSHENACAAAMAAECAARQGRGDAYNALLFANQGDLGSEALRRYARQAGIDLAAFEECIASKDAADAVARDVADGMAAGVESTPTFFINGRRIKGGMPRVAQYRYAFFIERERLAKNERD